MHLPAMNVHNQARFPSFDVLRDMLHYQISASVGVERYCTRAHRTELIKCKKRQPMPNIAHTLTYCRASITSKVKAAGYGVKEEHL